MNKGFIVSSLPLFPFVRFLSSLLFLASVALPSNLFAHRLDEYLQATIVVIQPERVRLQINFTPGVAVAEQVLPLIDRNGDGVISTNEAVAYCESLKRDLLVKLDERDLNLKLSRSNFPEPAELRTGWGIIQIEFSASFGSLSAGPHKLTIENRHLPTSSVYLVNAAPSSSPSIQIGNQLRNEDQSISLIEFTVSQGNIRRKN